MKVLIFLLTIFCCLFLSFSVVAQKKKVIRPTKITSKDVRLNKNKPHVFISFEREGKIDPLYEGESDRRIWLRLYNNSKWQIKFCSSPISPEYKEYGETEITYEIERYQGSGETPGTSSSDSCGYLLLNSGKSIRFSIPREHLSYGLAVKIPFRYEWETDPDGLESLLEPKHFVYFYSDDIPKT
jgi:hypothetical protein